MPFKRVWDSTCPRVYDRWETENASWVIQDLPPEDDDAALELLVTNMAPDEKLCNVSASMGIPVVGDEVSINSMAAFWRNCIKQRMSLACYVTENGKKTLAAMNCCIVACVDDQDDFPIEGEGWQNVYNALHLIEEKANVFKYLGLDKVLSAMGLVVRRDFRGAKLGARVLAAREPLALGQGIKATSTLFSGIASQKCAEKAGFTTLVQMSLKELAEAGLKYPKDDHVIKLMIKKFSS